MENYKLSPREFDCLVLAIYGYPIKRMANTLGISAKTVEGYMRDTCFKMHVSRKDSLHNKLTDLGQEYLSICLNHYLQLSPKSTSA